MLALGDACVWCTAARSTDPQSNGRRRSPGRAVAAAFSPNDTVASLADSRASYGLGALVQMAVVAGGDGRQDDGSIVVFREGGCDGVGVVGCCWASPVTGDNAGVPRGAAAAE